LAAEGREETAMTHRMAKILAAAIALGFGLETSFAPGMMPGVMSEAFAFGHDGSGGGGHFGGGPFGGGPFGGGHFGGRHVGGGHFGGRHFGGGHFGGRHFGAGHFGGGRFGHAKQWSGPLRLGRLPGGIVVERVPS
jgi:hypothetical protein